MSNIKLLQEGKLAVENDNIEALRKVLKAAGAGSPGGRNKYYIVVNGMYSGREITHLPSIPASVLVLELEEKPFEWGDKIYLSKDGIEWFEGIFLIACPKHANQPKDMIEGIRHGTALPWRTQFWSREFPKPKPAPLRITREMIAEKFGVSEFEIVN